MEARKARLGETYHHAIGLRDNVGDMFTDHAAKPAFFAVRPEDPRSDGYRHGGRRGAAFAPLAVIRNGVLDVAEGVVIVIGFLRGEITVDISVTVIGPGGRVDT